MRWIDLMNREQATALLMDYCAHQTKANRKIWSEAIIRIQGSARPDFDHRDRDWNLWSLNDETEAETENVWVSMTR